LRKKIPKSLGISEDKARRYPSHQVDFKVS